MRAGCALLRAGPLLAAVCRGGDPSRECGGRQICVQPLPADLPQCGPLADLPALHQAGMPHNIPINQIAALLATQK